MKNIGNVDRAFRAILGVIVLALGYYNQNYWGLVGFVFLGTATIAFCPLYRIFKISTCTKDLQGHEKDVIS